MRMKGLGELYHDKCVENEELKKILRKCKCMAIYRFRCEKCSEEKVIDAPMSEYDKLKDSQVCECGSKMKRVLEWEGSCKLCDGMYGIDKGSGWTK